MKYTIKKVVVRIDNKISKDTYDLGIRLKELRKQRELTQLQVSNYLDIHVKTVSAYENNNLTPSVDILIKLAILYRTSVDYILGVDNRPNIYLDKFSVKEQEYIQSSIAMFEKFLDKK